MHDREIFLFKFPILLTFETLSNISILLSDVFREYKTISVNVKSDFHDKREVFMESVIYVMKSVK